MTNGNLSEIPTSWIWDSELTPEKCGAIFDKWNKIFCGLAEIDDEAWHSKLSARARERSINAAGLEALIISRSILESVSREPQIDFVLRLTLALYVSSHGRATWNDLDPKELESLELGIARTLGACAEENVEAEAE